MSNTLPDNIRRFAWLYWAAALIVIVVEPLAWLGESPTNSVIAAVEGDGIYTLLVLVAFWPFFWLAVWKRKNWARWVLFLAFIVSLPFGFIDLHGQPLPWTSVFVGIISEIVEALAFYFLFTGDARPWFSRIDRPS